jgi:hypothetical protein
MDIQVECKGDGFDYRTQNQPYLRRQVVDYPTYLYLDGTRLHRVIVGKSVGDLIMGLEYPRHLINETHITNKET